MLVNSCFRSLASNVSQWQKRSFHAARVMLTGRRDAWQRDDLDGTSKDAASFGPFRYLRTKEELTVGITRDHYKDRRQRLMERLPENTVSIFPARPHALMTHDIPYPYRPDTDMYYLSGFPEPNSILVFDKTRNKDGIFMMFVEPSQPGSMKEVFDGPRLGIDIALSEYGAEEAYSVLDWKDKLQPLIKNASHIVLNTRVNEKLEAELFKEMAAQGMKERVTSAAHIIQNIRMYKKEEELVMLRKAAEVTARGFASIMRGDRTGENEMDLHKQFENECARFGSFRCAYPPVFASGINANTLHYIDNDHILKKGDMILVDAGAEYHMYPCDVSRTFPVGLKYTKPQRDLYDMVLSVQQQLIKECVADTVQNMQRLHVRSIDLISQGLKNLGISLSQSEITGVYPHFVGHYFGMDIHDCPNMPRTLPFSEGMMVTVEPGVYMPDSPKIPPWFRGIGIRIEDDVKINKTGPAEVLTEAIPKTIDDIENLK